MAVMATYPSTSTVIAAVAALYVGIGILTAWLARRKLAHIPTLGPSGFFQFYLGAYQLLRDARSMIQGGYDKYPGQAFKIPMLSKWLVVLHGPQMVEDVRKAAEDELSFIVAFAEGLQFEYTMDSDIIHNPFHISVVRKSLTWNLGVCFPDVNDEIKAAFADLVPATNDWTAVPAWKTMKQIVFRTSNRLFVGLPLCRDPDYRAINDEYATSLFKTIFMMSFVPPVLRPVAARFLFNYVPKVVKRALSHVGPTIEERLLKEKQLGPNWQGRPNDLISWLIEKAPPELRTVRGVTVRLLTLNFAALHSTSMAFTHTMYDLAAYPHHVAELRKEVETVIGEEGLSKDSLEKMYKLDSFIKETLRLHGPVEVSSRRKVLKDFTLSNGMVIPAGNTLAFAGIAMHRDNEYFQNPEQFDGFRFAKLREAEDEQVKYQAVALGREYVTFGVGRHACPGRWFAASELKAMLAHVLLNYDVKLEHEGLRPPDRWFAFTATPNPTASLLFRKRSTSG